MYFFLQIVIPWNDTAYAAKLMEFVEEDDPGFLMEHVHSLEEEMAHILHKCSIVILGILVVYVSIYST